MSKRLPFYSRQYWYSYWLLFLTFVLFAAGHAAYLYGRWYWSIPAFLLGLIVLRVLVRLPNPPSREKSNGTP